MKQEVDWWRSRRHRWAAQDCKCSSTRSLSSWRWWHMTAGRTHGNPIGCRVVRGAPLGPCGPGRAWAWKKILDKAGSGAGTGWDAINSNFLPVMSSSSSSSILSFKACSSLLPTAGIGSTGKVFKYSCTFEAWKNLTFDALLSACTSTYTATR